jgi:hypothetical protein
MTLTAKPAKQTTIMDRAEIRKLTDRLAELKAEQTRLAAPPTEAESRTNAAAEAFVAGDIVQGLALSRKRGESEFARKESLEAVGKAIAIVETDLAAARKVACDAVRARLIPKKAAAIKNFADMLDQLLAAIPTFAAIDQEYRVETGDDNVPICPMQITPRPITTLQHMITPYVEAGKRYARD